MHEFAWSDGKYNVVGKTNSKGGDVVIADDMPYRLQVQMHTGVDQADGLALAAMHTEVRLYVHAQTHAADLNPYDPATDQRSLLLRCMTEFLSTKTNLARGNGTEWCKLQLGIAGYHPGPVNGDANHAAYKMALMEFKRSTPKRKANAADDFARLPLDLTEGADVLDALEDVTKTNDWQRAWFGDPDANRVDLPINAALQDRLQDVTKNLIVWVDDRHFYTDPNWLGAAGVNGTVANKVRTSGPAMNNYTGAFNQGDALVGQKANLIPRPWLPLATDFILLSQKDDLNKVINTAAEASLAKMRQAVGPLRVDWTFDEIDTLPIAEPTIDTAAYGATVSRTRAYVRHVIDAKKSAAYARKDVTRNATYLNCPDANGGIRPAALANYYTTAFARTDDSLAPWRAIDCAPREAVTTVVHDNLGQADASIVAQRIGQAGVYFRPSIIGGDGYRVRAQVQFAALGDYKLPNLTVLAARYPRLPQVQSAGLRVWRKTTVRAYVCWSEVNNWVANENIVRRHYEPAYTHVTHERGVAKPSVVTDYFADDAAFKNLVRESLDPAAVAVANSPASRRSQAASIGLAAQYLWPWTVAPHFGVWEASAPNAALAAARTNVNDTVASPLFMRLANLFGLGIVDNLEKKHGRFRGHVILEFLATASYIMQRYQCDPATAGACHNRFYYVETTRAGGSMANQACGCGTGQLREQTAVVYGFYTCGAGHTYYQPEAALAGGGFVGAICVRPNCGQPLAATPAQREEYECGTCHWKGMLVETGAGGAHDNERCKQNACVGVMTHTAGWNETYRCDKCNAAVVIKEAAAAGGAAVGQAHAGCTAAPTGVLKRQAPPVIVVNHVLVAGNKVDYERTEELPGRVKGFPFPSLGAPLGTALVIRPNADTWAHELGHCRFLEHAANAPGDQPTQHDHENNTTFVWTGAGGIGENDVKNRCWDRACLMSYAPNQTTYDQARDRRYMCGRCAFKTRGWRLGGAQPVNNPPGATPGP
jgi:hypothetical protein